MGPARDDHRDARLPGFPHSFEEGSRDDLVQEAALARRAAHGSRFVDSRGAEGRKPEDDERIAG